MFKQIFKSTFLLLLLTVIGFTSCDVLEEQLNLDTETVQNFTEESIDVIERSAESGQMGCFEFVFPITINFPDESAAEVNSYEELRETISNWREAQGDEEIEGRPQLAFPLEVLNEAGEVISIAEKAELRTLRRECRSDRPNGSHQCGRCFSIVYPVTISFPDETTAEAEDRRTFKQLVREWKRANPDTEERPALIFPITVELEDETTVEINSVEELQALKESCRGEG
ncbi:MAG: hypothetical protein AB8G22_09200 [Saprospiraceae bacterium]